MKNKFYYYLKITIGNMKINYFVLIALITYVFSEYLLLLKYNNVSQLNIYDISISLSNSYLPIAYMLFLLFCLLYYNINSNKGFYKYVFLKNSSSMEWYKFNVYKIFLYSFTFATVIFSQCFLQGIIKLELNNSWSQYIVNLASNNTITYLYNQEMLSYIMKTFSPLTFVLINFFFVICFFIVIGLSIFILSLIIKNKIISFSIMFFINCLNIVIYIGDLGVDFIRKISLYYNLIILSPPIGDINAFSIVYRILYWIILITVLIIIGNIIKSKVDFYYEK